MDFSSFNDVQLITLHEDLGNLYVHDPNKKYFLGDGTKTPTAVNSIYIVDARLGNLLSRIRVEVYNELCERFSHKIEIPTDVVQSETPADSSAPEA